MRLLKTKPHYSDAELLKKLHSQKDINTFKSWQIIYAVQTSANSKAIEISNVLGITKSKIYRLLQAYNKHGKDWQPLKPRGGRREERSLMTLEEERQLLAEAEQDALSGKILIYKHIKTRIEEKLCHKVSNDYVWDLFKRHGWTKKVPRKQHPKTDKKQQEEFKKNSLNFWQPNR
jgi:transposase